jgi:hypothetical protein
MTATRVLRVAAWAALLLAGGAAPAQDDAAVAGAVADPVAVADASFGGDRWLRRDEPIEITLSRLPAPGEGRLAVFVGPRDVTALVTVEGATLRYEPSFTLHETGASEVTVYLVTPDEQWVELDRRALQVKSRAGFEESQLDPHLDVSLESLLTEQHSDDFEEPERHSYLKGTLQGGWTSRHQIDGTEITTYGNLVGASFQEEALRFGEEGREAPRLDLSDYFAEVRRGDTAVQLGHFSYGNHRHLLSSFSSRGIQALAKPHPRLDFTSAFFNATSIVGYNNFAGVESSEHMISASRLGLQLLEDHPFGNARLEGSWMSGSRESRSDFNAGQITDAEKSWGYGARFFGDLFWNRLHTDASWARSRFDNPADPFQELNGQSFNGDTTTENARYGSAALDLIQNLRLRGERYANLSVFASHERIDPQFKSLGTFTFSDMEINVYGFNADLAGIQLQAQKSFSEDNLDEIPQILKTRSRDTLVTVQVPLPYLVSYESPPFWLPTLAYTYNRVHQYGVNGDELDPDLSGFAASSIPDQVDERHDAVVSWSWGAWNLGYHYLRGHQDNLQEGRDIDDFRDETHDVNLGLQAFETVYVSLGASRTQQWNRALELRRRTLGLNASLDWQFLPSWTFSAMAQKTRETQSGDLVATDSSSLDAQLAYQFVLPAVRGYRVPGRVYLRWSRQSNRFRDDTFGLEQRPSQWQLLMGMSVSLF